MFLFQLTKSNLSYYKFFLKQRAKPKVVITPAKVKMSTASSSAPKSPVPRAAAPSSAPAIKVEPVPVVAVDDMEEVAVDPADDVATGPDPENLCDAIAQMLQKCESDEVMILGL